MSETKTGLRDRGLTLRYANDVSGTSIYNLFVDDPAPQSTDPDAEKLQHLVAVVEVDHETRAIEVSTPDYRRVLKTNGLASLKSADGVMRFSSMSVADYVFPRAGRLIAQLYAVNA